MSMKILHFSDPHAGGGAEDWMAYLDKRWVGVFNYTFRRRFRFNLKRLETLVRYIIANPVDLVVCTGDLTSTGQPGEFNTIKEILQPLRDSNIPIIYTPGNHDCYVKRDKCVKAMEEMVEYLSRGRYRFSDMPVVLKVGECDFILLNTSRPSNLLCSWGFVSRSDSRFIEQLCRQPKERPRILVGHYPLLEDHPILRMRHRLFGQKKLVALLQNGAIDLSLCGHVHRPVMRLDDSGRGESIAGSITCNGSCSLIQYDRNSDRFIFQRVEVDDNGNAGVKTV